MRNRIFTDFEKGVIKAWLERDEKNVNTRILLSRIRRAKELREDIELYKKVMEKLTQSSSR
jgi:hypothetical protein